MKRFSMINVCNYVPFVHEAVLDRVESALGALEFGARFAILENMDFYFLDEHKDTRRTFHFEKYNKKVDKRSLLPHLFLAQAH